MVHCNWISTKLKIFIAQVTLYFAQMRNMRKTKYLDKPLMSVLKHDATVIYNKSKFYKKCECDKCELCTTDEIWGAGSQLIYAIIILCLCTASGYLYDWFTIICCLLEFFALLECKKYTFYHFCTCLQYILQSYIMKWDQSELVLLLENRARYCCVE